MTAWAADCPDGRAAVLSAERDAVSYYISDAQASLADAATAFGCSQTETTLLARYWLAQAMLWNLGEDPRYTAALAAAKTLEPTLYTDDFGPELREEWEKATRPEGDPVAVQVRGLEKGDSVLVDGMLAEPAQASPGMHLMQIRRGGEVVFGRLITVEPRRPATVDVRVATVQLPPTLPTGRWEGPLEVRRGVRDSTGRRIPTFELAGAVANLDGGMDALRGHRRANALRIPALGIAGLGLYGTYLSLWEGSVGTTLSDGQNALLFGTGLMALAGGTTWEILLRTRRRKYRKQLADLANGSAP